MNQSELAWAKRTKDIAGFASPWVAKPHVKAHAYPTALNFSDALKGLSSRRSSVIFHMANRGEAGKLKCELCGGKLNEAAKAVNKKLGAGVTLDSAAGNKPDEHSTWNYDAKKKQVTGGVHYLCSWSSLFGRIAQLRVIR